MTGLRFDRFVLDPADRRLTRDGLPVELNARYFDALALLVGDAGKLVTKERFLGEVWRGVPVTDEALTQCIKTLRARLGDDAVRPRFIETVPKHGYRFIAPLERAAARPRAGAGWREFLVLGGAGTLGAGVAGVIGGLAYGFAGAAQPLAADMGATSILLVLMWLTIAAAVIGGAGVSFGIAAGGLVPGRSLASVIAGGAIGGMVVGAVAKLLGLDGFHLLLGQSPGDITGAAEGAALGGAVGLGAGLALAAARPLSLRRRVAIAAAASGAAGGLIPLFGGRLMGGSLDLLAHHFPDSRLRIDPIGALFGENGFGTLSQIVTGALEGMLFGGGIVGAMLLAQRSLASETRPVRAPQPLPVQR